MSLLKDLIDEDVLADARKIDKFTRKHDPGLPSIENTLRLIRDVDTDVPRRVGRDVWGVGGSEGADLVRTSFDKCVTELDRAVSQAGAWTGEAKNAYGDRINQIKGSEDQHRGLHAMRSPAEDVGQALVDMADSFDSRFGESVADIFTVIGLVIAAIGAVVAIATFETGVGAIIGLVIAILGLIVAVVCQVAAENSYYQNHVTACEDASAAASTSLSSAQLASP